MILAMLLKYHSLFLCLPDEICLKFVGQTGSMLLTELHCSQKTKTNKLARHVITGDVKGAVSL